jgi:hypothetical protein
MLVKGSVAAKKKMANLRAKKNIIKKPILKKTNNLTTQTKMATRRRIVRRVPVRRPVRRRRISGMGSSNVLMTIAGLAGGAILARIASNVITKAKPDLNLKLIAAAQIGLGIYLPKILKSQLGKDLGAGMISAGGVGLVTSLGVIKGIDVVSGVDDAITEDYFSTYIDNLNPDTQNDELSNLDSSMNGIDVVSGIGDMDSEYNY